MRVKTELSERPAAFTVGREGDKAVITFYTDVEQLEKDEGKAWSATAWTMIGNWTDRLEERIAARPEVWFNLVQAKCYAEERKIAIETQRPTVEDLTAAVLELGELFAAQDDALVELAELIEEGG